MALAWAREWARNRGQVTDQNLIREYESLYTEQQRRDILALCIIMDFANRWNNTFTGMVLILPTMTPK